MGCIPAKPCENKLHAAENIKKDLNSIKLYIYAHLKIYIYKNYLARKATPSIQSFVEYTFINLPATICNQKYKEVRYHNPLNIHIYRPFFGLATILHILYAETKIFVIYKC